MRCLLALLLICLTASAFGQEEVLNIYAWTGEVPESLLRQFEKETGIKVNFSTYENNEVMYSKLRATRNAGYDLVMPSSYFVHRMLKQKMLEEIDRSKLSNYKNLDPTFTHPNYDPQGKYSIPYLWGVTGIFYNDEYFTSNSFSSWNDLWRANLKNQVMLLDDNREVFSMALLSLGYSPNDQDPAQVLKAFRKLQALIPNVKVFSSDTVVSIMIDEDVTVGMAWNGDAYKASLENEHIKFVFPKDGFVIWVDTFAIPKGAPHLENAYKFLNFILDAKVARDASLITSYPITNAAGQKLLPQAVRTNPMIYPSKEVLARGMFQSDVGEAIISIYESDWEQLKMSE
jgi:spermidine/putrescine transport system substrate-binding protein